MVGLWWSEEFQGSPQLRPHDAERRQSVGQLCVWSLLFSSLGSQLVALKQMWWKKCNVRTVVIHIYVDWHIYSDVFSTGECLLSSSKYLWEVSCIFEDYKDYVERVNCDTLRKLHFQFLSHWMGYDHGDSFPFDFLNQMEFHLVQNRKENCNHDHIPFNVKGIGSIVFSV